MEIRRFLLITLGLLGIGSGFLLAQPRLAFTNAAGIPAVVSQGQSVSLSGWIVNLGTSDFTGDIDIVLHSDSAQAHPLDNNFPAGTIAPGDSVYWSVANYNFPPGILRLNNNDVLIWPTRPSGSGTVAADSLATTIFYTDESAFRLRNNDFNQYFSTGVSIEKDFDLHPVAVNHSKSPNVSDVCFWAVIPGHAPICLAYKENAYGFRDAVDFGHIEVNILSVFGLELEDDLSQVDRIGFYVQERVAHTEPCDVVSLDVNAPVGRPDPGMAAGVTVFPNPASQSLHITVPAAWQADAFVTLRDVTGRTVLATSLGQGVIDLGDLAAGSYALEIKSRRGLHRQMVVRR